jgi:hypothetical protein
MQKAEQVTRYFQTFFLAELRGKAMENPLPDWILDGSTRLDLLEDCNYAAKMLVQAMRNQSE